MIFEVLRDGVVLMTTHYEECIPPPEILKSMMEAKYTFTKDGKAWKPPVAEKQTRKKKV